MMGQKGNSKVSVVMGATTHRLPETGFLRLPQIIGDSKAQPPVPAVIPVCKSTWWAGVKSGKFPQPVKLGSRTAAWRVEDIRALVEAGISYETGDDATQPGLKKASKLVEPVTRVDVTLRDYFAAAALPAILAQQTDGINERHPNGNFRHPEHQGQYMTSAQWWAEEAYQIADAMIAERAK